MESIYIVGITFKNNDCVGMKVRIFETHLSHSRDRMQPSRAGRFKKLKSNPFKVNAFKGNSCLKSTLFGSFILYFCIYTRIFKGYSQLGLKKKKLKSNPLKVNAFKGNSCLKSTLFGSPILYFFIMIPVLAMVAVN